MKAVNPSSVPGKNQAVRAFTTAMDQWDEAAADSSAAALARHLTSTEAFEIFARYAARDMRSIQGTKRFTSPTPGGRSKRSDGSTPSPYSGRWPTRFWRAREAIHCGRRSRRSPRPRNQGLAGRLPPNWRAGRTDSGATVEMLAVLRNGTENETADRAADLLRRGIGPQSVWDALMCGGGEILMRDPGIVPLHSVTTTNAIR